MEETSGLYLFPVFTLEHYGDMYLYSEDDGRLFSFEEEIVIQDLLLLKQWLFENYYNFENEFCLWKMAWLTSVKYLQFQLPN